MFAEVLQTPSHLPFLKMLQRKGVPRGSKNSEVTFAGGRWEGYPLFQILLQGTPICNKITQTFWIMING